MKIHRWLIGVGLALLTACTIWSEATLEPIPPSLFEVACAETRVDCTDMRAPVIIYSAWPELLSAVGVFVPDEPYIYINRMKTSVPWEQIILHETVHYVLYYGGVELSNCESEEKARVITARHFNLEVDPTWRKRYNCPAPL